MSAGFELGALVLRRTQRRLRHTIGGAGHRTSTRDALEVHVHAAHAGQKLVGRGEAAPLPGYSIDALSDVEVALARLGSSKLPPLQLDGFVTEAIAEQFASLPPSARAALECALLDLAGQALGRPMWSVLGGTAPVALALGGILSGPDETLAAESATLAKSGIKTQKRKLDGDSTAASLAALGPLVGAGVALRLDANRSFSVEQLRTLTPAIVALGPTLLEEPVNADLAAWMLAEPKSTLTIPIGVDESLAARTSQAALAALHRFAPAITAGRVGAIVVKPARDGLLGALAIARAAARLGAPVVVTHLWDGPIGHLAAVQLATAIGTTASPAQGLALHGGLEGELPDAALDDLRALVVAGALQVPTRAGLGLSAAR